MPDMQSPQHPLEVLPAMLNLVLLQTAKILRDPDSRNPKQAGLTKRRITEIVTVANQRFHDALDEIEIEILRAKAVMERDLRLISKQRADKDRANGIMTEPSPLKETQETLPSNAASEADPMLVDTSAEYAEESRPATGDASDPTIKVLTETVRAAPESTNREAVTNYQDVLQDFDNSMGLAITIPSDDMTKAAEQPKSPEGDIEAADLNEAPSEIPDNIDLDFESMFNDTDPKDLEELKNIDFDTAIDPAVAEDIIKNLADLPATASEDIDSLLPGVESYLNADTNFSNTTMPPATTIPETSQPTASSTAEAPAQTGEEQAMADTSFDDNFFGLGDFEMGETGGDELGDGTLGDFEDFDWS